MQGIHSGQPQPKKFKVCSGTVMNEICGMNVIKHCAAEDKKQVDAKKSGKDKRCGLIKPEQTLETLTQME